MFPEYFVRNLPLKHYLKKLIPEVLERKSHNSDNITPESLTFLVEYARSHKAANPNLEGYIFGHMHYPYLYDSKELNILFLSDWSGKEATYGLIDNMGNAQLKTFAIDETVS